MADKTNKSIFQGWLDDVKAAQALCEKVAHGASTFVASMQKNASALERLTKDLAVGVEYGGGTVANIEDEMTAYIPAKFRKQNGDQPSE